MRMNEIMLPKTLYHPIPNGRKKKGIIGNDKIRDAIAKTDLQRLVKQRIMALGMR